MTAKLNRKWLSAPNTPPKMTVPQKKVKTVLFGGVKFSSVAMENRKVARRCIIDYYKNIFSAKKVWSSGNFTVSPLLTSAGHGFDSRLATLKVMRVTAVCDR